MHDKQEIVRIAFENIPAAQQIFTDKTLHNPVDFLVGLTARLTFNPEFLWESPDNAWMNVFYQMLSTTSSWKKVRDRVKNSLALGIIGALTIATYTRFNFPRQQGNQPSLRELEEMIEIAQSSGLVDRANSLRAELVEARKVLARHQDGIKTIKTYIQENAVTHALTDVESATEVLANGKDLSIPKVTNASTLAAVVNSLKLLSEGQAIDVLKEVGRLETACGYRQVVSTDKPNTGITFGNDVANLLSDEWLKSDDQFDLEFCEEKLSQHAVGKSSVKAGDLIVLLDESSSMAERVKTKDMTVTPPTREVMGKAILMLMVRIAKAQKRGIYLITYDYKVRRTYDLKKASLEQIAEVLSGDSDGVSTSWEKAIESAIEVIQGKDKSVLGRYKKADIVLITDADTHGIARDARGHRKRCKLTLIDDEAAKKVNRLKAKCKFQIHGILIGDSNAEDELRKIADRVIKIGDLSDRVQLGNVVSAVAKTSK